MHRPVVRLGSDRGATMVEFGLLVALIAIAMVGAVAVIGIRSSVPFTRAGSTLTTVAGDASSPVAKSSKQPIKVADIAGLSDKAAAPSR